jgi:WD40 repeat protein
VTCVEVDHIAGTRRHADPQQFELSENTQEIVFCSSFSQMARPAAERPEQPELREIVQPLEFSSLSQIRGCSASVLNAIQSNYLPALVASPSELSPPPLHLSLHHVFGFEFMDRRNTVAYCGQLQEFDKLCYVRQGFRRQVLSIVDRVAVLHKATRMEGLMTSPDDYSQRHYQEHSAKIGCVAVHPDKLLIATGECSDSSWIHVWNSTTLQTVKQIRTFHRGAIMNMAFSYDGKYLASLGLQNVFSLQICEWQSERVLAYAKLSERPLLDLRFDPIDHSMIAACGVNCIQYFRLEGTSLQAFLLLELNHLGRPVATCIDFIFFLSNRQPKTELLIGTSSGDLLVASYKQKQAVVALPKAHSAAVTLIKVSCCLSTIIKVFTAGRDGLVKVWDSKLQLHRTINVGAHILAKVDRFKVDTPVSMNPALDPSKVSIIMPQNRKIQENVKYRDDDMAGDHSLQSLDFWHEVETQLDEPHGRLPYLLMATKSGFMVEAVLEPLPARMIERDEDPHDEAVIELSQADNATKKQSDYAHVSLLSRSQQTTRKGYSEDIVKKHLCSVHPTRSFIAIIASNEELVIRDFDTTLILVKFQFNEDNPSTAMTWHPKEDLLTIGFQSGIVHIYSFAESVGVDLSAELRVKLDSFLPPVAASPVLSVTFDSPGIYMAVSFCSSGHLKDDSFVKVYIDRAKAASEHGQQTLMEGRYAHYFDIRCPSIQSSYDSALKSYSMAAYFMEFSVDSRFLMLCFQLIDDKLRRNNQNSQAIYMLWDIKLNNPARNWEIQKEAEFHSLRFPISCKGRYTLFNPRPACNREPGDFQDLGPSLYSHMASFSAICQFRKSGTKPTGHTPLFLGDEAGFLHVTVVSSMYAPESDPNSSAECLASLVKAHASGVDWIECSGDGRWLFTRGVNDTAIMMWRISEFSKVNDLDYLSLPAGSTDVFGEVPQQFAIEYCLTNVLQQRIQAAEIANNTSRETEGEVYLELDKVIGRTAHAKRNNICYSSDNKLLMISGTLLVLLTIPERGTVPSRSILEKYFRQTIISPACFWKKSPAPELSSLAICHANAVVCVSTFERVCRLLFWQVPSQTYIGTVALVGYCSVVMLRFAEDNRTLALLALTQTSTSALILVDSQSFRVSATAVFSYSAAFKIKDLSFLPGVNDRLVTSGVMHLKLWQLAGGILHGCNLEIGMSIANAVESVPNPTLSEVGRFNQVEDKTSEDSSIGSTFLSLIVFETYIVCGDDDGCVDTSNQDQLVPQPAVLEEGTMLNCCASALSDKRPGLARAVQVRVCIRKPQRLSNYLGADALARRREQLGCTEGVPSGLRQRSQAAASRPSLPHPESGF